MVGQQALEVVAGVLAAAIRVVQQGIGLAATRMAELGVSIEHIARVLNHAPRGITATVHDKHTYVPEKRRALDTWADYLKGIVAPEPAGNVVKLRG